MGKKERNSNFRKLVKELAIPVLILNSQGKTWNHVRIEGFGDIWPSTGTFRRGDKWYKRNYDKMIATLTNHFNGKESPKGEVVSKKETQDMILNELLKRVEDLEIKVYQLENKV